MKTTEGFSEFKHLKRSGYYSFQLALSSMIYAVTSGSKTAVSSLPLPYVLCDSRFTCQALIA
ncbi:MAG: hypothetical protein PHU11_00695 [Dysgonamonadaceae bacterium]|nr:hypothetical protein [Dysgonamonadaceae bacterium]